MNRLRLTYTMPAFPDSYLNRVICGDALQVIKELPPKSIDLIVTDPPYGDNTSYGTKHTRIAGNEHPLVGLQAMSLGYRTLKPNRTAYMFCGMRHFAFIRSFFAAYTPYKLRDVIIWDKVSMGVGYGFRKQYECILVLEKGKPHYRNSRMLNILRYPRVRSNVHPHAKPVSLIKNLILHSSDASNTVLDPFVGSGTTAVAAQQTKRKFIGVEADEKFYRESLKRLRAES